MKSQIEWNFFVNRSINQFFLILWILTQSYKYEFDDIYFKNFMKKFAIDANKVNFEL